MRLVDAFVIVTVVVAGCQPQEAATAQQLSAPPAGLSLFFRDGVPDRPALDLSFDAPRFVQELDLEATVVTATDQGIEPATHQGDLADLDWSGVAQVEEDWRPDFDGTWIRQRFYRGAAWMEGASTFRVVPVDDAGTPVGTPIIALAGADDTWAPSDDGFVRRFVARQYVRGCRAKNDCSNATHFEAEALVQLRDALHPALRAQTIPADAAALSLEWSAEPHHARTIPLTRSASPYGPGFQIVLSAVTPPANGSYYVPGDAVTFQATFEDGAGHRLHPEGSLPTYGQFLRGEVASGLHYYDGFRLEPTLYYALKHREANMILALDGPVDRIRVPSRTIDTGELFLPQIETATPAVDGYTGLVQFIPAGAVLFGGAFDPSAWETPVPDRFTFTIPADALPGTYVVALKARRDFGGEALDRGTTIEIQVGTATRSEAQLATGNCAHCHTGPSSLDVVNHGLADRRACVACHPSLAFEPDNALDIRVHTVHDRSNRFPGDVHDCALCHLVPPTGPARGIREE
jgi:hypothetical protein